LVEADWLWQRLSRGELLELVEALLDWLLYWLLHLLLDELLRVGGFNWLRGQRLA